MAFDCVGELNFGWVVSDVDGTFVVEVSTIPLTLIAYDSVWLEVN